MRRTDGESIRAGERKVLQRVHGPLPSASTARRKRRCCYRRQCRSRSCVVAWGPADVRGDPKWSLRERLSGDNGDAHILVLFGLGLPRVERPTCWPLDAHRGLLELGSERAWGLGAWRSDSSYLERRCCGGGFGSQRILGAILAGSEPADPPGALSLAGSACSNAVVRGRFFFLDVYCRGSGDVGRRRSAASKGRVAIPRRDRRAGEGSSEHSWPIFEGSLALEGRSLAEGGVGGREKPPGNAEDAETGGFQLDPVSGSSARR